MQQALRAASRSVPLGIDLEQMDARDALFGAVAVHRDGLDGPNLIGGLELWNEGADLAISGNDVELARGIGCRQRLGSLKHS